MKNPRAGVKQILIIEDEPGIRQICQRILASQECHLDFDNNGASAEAMLKETDYDLILIDIKTPIMNGKEFYKHLEDVYPKLKSRVIFTTGDVISNDTQSFLRDAGRPFLLKPFTPNELQAIIWDNLNIKPV